MSSVMVNFRVSEKVGEAGHVDVESELKTPAAPSLAARV